MKSIKGNWLFSLLWVNVAVLIVVLVQVIGNQITSVRAFVYAMGLALVFANLTGVLALVVIGALAARFQRRKIGLFPMIFICIVVFVPTGCLLAEALLMARWHSCSAQLLGGLSAHAARQPAVVGGVWTRRPGSRRVARTPAGDGAEAARERGRRGARQEARNRSPLNFS
jgi:hypothetical protein